MGAGGCLGWRLATRGGAVWQLVGLITRRWQVRILPPLPTNEAGASHRPRFVSAARDAKGAGFEPALLVGAGLRPRVVRIQLPATNHRGRCQSSASLRFRCARSQGGGGLRTCAAARWAHSTVAPWRMCAWSPSTNGSKVRGTCTRALPPTHAVPGRRAAAGRRARRRRGPKSSPRRTNLPTRVRLHRLQRLPKSIRPSRLSRVRRVRKSTRRAEALALRTRCARRSSFVPSARLSARGMVRLRRAPWCSRRDPRGGTRPCKPSTSSPQPT